ncbi:B3 DNA binding domain containing protein, partial [Trema orientale]
MSCGPQGDRSQTKYSSGTPHFFTIILEETLQENKLRIPQKFVRKYGETLSNSVFVKLPCGSKWKMKLTEQDKKIWFEKGWPDFAKHYALKRGSMLTFRYEGNSEFQAVIFDTSTVEIDYPSIPVVFDKSDIDLELRDPKEEVVEDDSIEILANLSPCPKAREKSPLPCSQPHKRIRTSPTDKTQSNSAGPSECLRENSRSKGNLQSSKAEIIGKPDSPSKIDRDKFTTRSQKTDEILVRMRTQVYRSEKVAVLQKAFDFRSDRPHFKVVIQPSYNHL